MVQRPVQSLPLRLSARISGSAAPVAITSARHPPPNLQPPSAQSTRPISRPASPRPVPCSGSDGVSTKQLGERARGREGERSLLIGQYSSRRRTNRGNAPTDDEEQKGRSEEGQEGEDPNQTETALALYGRTRTRTRTSQGDVVLSERDRVADSPDSRLSASSSTLLYQRIHIVYTAEFCTPSSTDQDQDRDRAIHTPALDRAAIERLSD